MIDLRARPAITRSWVVALAVSASSLLPAAPAAAQSDVRLWTSGALRYDVNRDLLLTFTQNLRFDENISRLRRFMPEGAIGYDALDFMRLSAGYRFVYDRGGNGAFRTGHRFNVDMRLRGDVERIRFSYRLRLQESLTNKRTRTAGRTTIRNRIGAAWRNSSPITPQLSTEIFTRAAGKNRAFAYKWRLTIGASYRTGPHELEVYYRLQVPIEEPGDPVLHILGVGYRFRFSPGRRGRRGRRHRDDPSPD